VWYYQPIKHHNKTETNDTIAATLDSSQSDRPKETTSTNISGEAGINSFNSTLAKSGHGEEPDETFQETESPGFWSTFMNKIYHRGDAVSIQPDDSSNSSSPKAGNTSEASDEASGQEESTGLWGSLMEKIHERGIGYPRNFEGIDFPRNVLAKQGGNNREPWEMEGKTFLGVGDYANKTNATPPDHHLLPSLNNTNLAASFDAKKHQWTKLFKSPHSSGESNTVETHYLYHMEPGLYAFVSTEKRLRICLFIKFFLEITNRFRFFTTPLFSGCRS